MSAGLVVDPVESGLDGEPREHPVLGAVPVGRGEVHAAALVVQRVGGVEPLLVPALRDAQLDARPLVHHRNGERVELLLAPLRTKKKQKINQKLFLFVDTGERRNKKKKGDHTFEILS